MFLFVFIFHLDGKFMLFHLKKKKWTRGLYFLVYAADFMYFDGCVPSLSPLFSRKW